MDPHPAITPPPAPPRLTTPPPSEAAETQPTGRPQASGDRIAPSGPAGGKDDGGPNSRPRSRSVLRAGADAARWAIRRARAVAAANAVAAQMEADGLPFERTVRQAIAQLAFEMCLKAKCDPPTLKIFFTLLLRARAVDVSEGRLEVERRKVAALEARLQAAATQIQRLRRAEPGLTEAERTAILDSVDEILGLK